MLGSFPACAQARTVRALTWSLRATSVVRSRTSRSPDAAGWPA
ncbi:MAG TPA: hypothetical protein VJ849_11950 [Actinomycetes bacterium]|nr:hypothetical protein [Actinomycetes bacterium]